MRSLYVLRHPTGEVVTRRIAGERWEDAGPGTEDRVGSDWWVLPGLVDAHSHIAASELDYQPGNLEQAMTRSREALRSGVTLLLDKGWTDDTAVRVIAEVPVQERPDIEAAARLVTKPFGYFPGFAHEVEASGLEDAIRTEGEAGAGWVKVVGDWPRKGLGPVSNFTEDELRLVVDVAESVGSRVAIHTMAEEAPSAAVRAGVYSIEHGLFLDSDDVGILGSRAGMWVPTFLRVEATLAQLGESSSGGRLLARGLANAAGLLSEAVDAGVRVLAGTDLVGSPANVAAEAIKLGEYGLSPAQMLDAVSSSGLRATGRDSHFEVGSFADAVFFPSNPLEEPAVLAHPIRVVRRGRVV